MQTIEVLETSGDSQPMGAVSAARCCKVKENMKHALAAAFTGIMSSTFIDRFERKQVFIITITGLILSNIFSANAWNYESLLASRFLAGAFGGPATSLCFAIVADLFDKKSRGAVMGKVMGGFSLAAVFGVPIGLKMSELFGWQAKL